MKTKLTMKKLIIAVIVVVLYTTLSAALFLIMYGLAIYISNGIAGGKAAAGISILCVVTIYLLLRKTKLLKSNAKQFAYILTSVLFITFVIYTVIPVASSHTINKEKDFPEVPTQYWNLSTGSKIAYYKLEANKNVEKKETPIIFLHGGPGAFIRQMEINFFSEFAKEGYDVYLYDQVGAGRSGLLPKEQYSHVRNIKDFAAITDVIKAKKYIVIGQSYGGSLLAHIAADKQLSKRIYKAIYAEPGVTVPSELSEDQKVYSHSKPVAVNDVTFPVRILISLLLNPKGDFVSQNEVVNYLTDHPAKIQSLFAEAYPKNDSARVPKVNLGVINFSVNRVVALEVNFYDSKKELTDKYLKYRVPSMLLIGESSYIERNAPLDLLSVNRNIDRVQYIKGVGHLLWNGLDNNNQRVKDVILNYLNGDESNIPNYPQKKDIKNFYQRKL